MRTLQNNLQLIRNQKKKTQEQVALDLHISRSAYTMYETGKRFPDVATLHRLASYFDVPLEYLYSESNQQCADELNLYLKMTHAERKILKIYRLLSDYGRGRLVERAETLMEEHRSLVNPKNDVINFDNCTDRLSVEDNMVIRIF